MLQHIVCDFYFFRSLYYKTFYGRNLRIFIINLCVCLWQAFTAKSNVWGWGQEPTLEWSTWKVLHKGRLARDRHSSLLRKSVNYGRKKFYSTGAKCLYRKFTSKLRTVSKKQLRSFDWCHGYLMSKVLLANLNYI